MATCLSDLRNKIAFLEIWEEELRGTLLFLEGSCAMELWDAVYTSAPCSLPILLGCHLLGWGGHLPPVLSRCAREELCEKWGCTLLSNHSCLDQYLQPESDFNKRTLSALLSPWQIDPSSHKSCPFSCQSLGFVWHVGVLTQNTNISQLANGLEQILKRFTFAITWCL